jgi:hypothetical protein
MLRHLEQEAAHREVMQYLADLPHDIWLVREALKSNDSRYDLRLAREHLRIAQDRLKFIARYLDAWLD